MYSQTEYDKLKNRIQQLEKIVKLLNPVRREKFARQNAINIDELCRTLQLERDTKIIQNNPVLFDIWLKRQK